MRKFEYVITEDMVIVKDNGVNKLVLPVEGYNTMLENGSLDERVLDMVEMMEGTPKTESKMSTDREEAIKERLDNMYKMRLHMKAMKQHARGTSRYENHAAWAKTYYEKIQHGYDFWDVMKTN